MWSVRQEQRGRALHFVLHRDAEFLAFSDVIHLWEVDAVFRVYFNALLAGSPFEAFRWETPPITSVTAGRPFEFALLDAPELLRTPDRESFAEHFETAADDVVSFANLSGDAILVVPKPIAPATAYGHIAAFVRQAPEAQRHALWKRVGESMRQRLGKRPVWLSTAGAGVSWLHVRLDVLPKYYGYERYLKPG